MQKQKNQNYPQKIKRQQKKVMVQALNVRHEKCSISCKIYQIFGQFSSRILYQEPQSLPQHNTLECQKQLAKLLEYKRNKQRRIKKFRKIKNLIFKRELRFLTVQRLRESIKKLQQYNYSTNAIAASQSITPQQVYYLNQNSELEQPKEDYFNFKRSHITWIKKFIITHESFELYESKQIYQQFLSEFNLTQRALSQSYFIQIMKKHCKATYKIPLLKDVRGTNNQDIKYNYALQYLNCSINNVNFVFLDETIFSYHHKEQRCWQLRGDIQKYQKYQKKRHMLFVLGAIGMNDFLANQLIKGHVNSEVYQYQLCSLIKKLKQHYEEQQFVLILDNSRIHKSKKVRKLLTAVRNIFLPPYSPQLNPIEKLWHLLKQHIYKNIIPCSSDIDKLIHQFFGKFQGQEIEKLIMSMIPSLRLAFINKKYDCMIQLLFNIKILILFNEMKNGGSTDGSNHFFLDQQYILLMYI